MKQMCLAMIVKNEAKVIARCLRSARKHVDTYCIFDTGSTDRTKEIIKAELNDVPGALIDTNWTNFGEARTKVFNFIRKNKMAKYALVLDADDEIIADKIAPDPIYDSAEVKIQASGLEYYQLRIFDMNKEWEYVGAVHELPMIKGNGGAGLVQTRSDIVIKHNDDGNSWSDPNKSQKYIDLAKSQDLTTPRHQFYYAQVLRGAGRLHEAIKEYTKRIEMTTGWKQEAVYSQLMIARMYHTMGELDKALLEYMKCYEMDPERGEALTEIVCMLRAKDKFNLGLMFGNELLKVSKTPQTNKLFAENLNWATIYNEIGLCEYYTGNKTTAKRRWKTALKSTPTNELQKTIKNNMTFI